MYYLVFLLLCSPVFSAVSLSPADSKPVRHFIQEYSAESSIPTSWLEEQFDHAKMNQDVLSLIQKPYEDKIWGSYEKLFITDKRVRGGKRFLQNHEQELNQIAQEYGVPRSIIVAILGVETNYGENMGRFNALEALSTLSFFYAPRHSFFEGELKSLLGLAYKKGWNLQRIEGSYAGALGMPQFMPSNINLYAVGSPDGTINLFHNTQDAMRSIGNYLKKHGKWTVGQPIVAPITTLSAEQKQSLNDLFESRNIIMVDQAVHDIFAAGELPKPSSKRLIRLRYTDKAEFFEAFDNFKSIMSYNNSTNYAFAVTSLAASIDEQQQLNKNH